MIHYRWRVRKVGPGRWEARMGWTRFAAVYSGPDAFERALWLACFASERNLGVTPTRSFL